MQKIYRVREKAPEEVHAALAAHSELLRDLLHARGVSDAEQASQFLSPDFARDSHDPFLLPDMCAGVDRIIAARRADELICVWSDYDCDGIPGGVALTEFLRDIGCRVRHYIPHRHLEGYGINEEGLGEIAREGATLVITVDLGIVEHANVEHARTLGMEVIITDHHLPQETLPAALAVINPHRADSIYPFRELCGAGVVWKLIQALLQKMRASGEPFDYAQGKPFEYPQGKEKWLLDLVGLATLSDMVPLQGENRMLASYGLIVMRQTRRPGLRALFKMLRINLRTLAEDDLTFMLSPRINAASRMAHPELAARLLATNDEEEGGEIAQELNRINDERKGTVAAIMKEARHRLAERAPDAPQEVIVMGNPKWRPGVLGLVANSLMESEGVPVFLWGREGSEMLKGSCRSDGSVNVVELMTAANDVLEGFGGHELAGGFSLREERAHELESALSSAYQLLSDAQGKAEEIIIDRELTIADCPRAIREVQRLSPFGEGNRKPLFLLPNVLVSRIKMFGKNNDHLELSLCGDDGSTIASVSFFSNVDSFHKIVTEGMRADIVAHIETDFRSRPRLRIVDVI